MEGELLVAWEVVVGLTTGVVEVANFVGVVLDTVDTTLDFFETGVDVKAAAALTPTNKRVNVMGCIVKSSDNKQKYIKNALKAAARECFVM